MTPLLLRSAHPLMALMFLATATACSDSTGPTVDAVAGTYTATQLSTVQNGVTTNQLAAGASITLTLNANGTTSGQFIVPGEINADLTGTWTLDDDTVTLSHSADTFLRDMALEVRGNRLVGDDTFSGTRVLVTLTKQ